MQAYLTVSRLFFAVIALAHLARVLRHWPLIIGTTLVPVWVSVVGLLVAGGLSLWGFRVARGLSH